MPSYPALIDGEDGAYGVTFPDLPGIVAMGATIEEAASNAEEALRDYAIESEADGEEIISPSSLDDMEISSEQRLIAVPLMFFDSREARAS